MSQEPSNQAAGELYLDFRLSSSLYEAASWGKLLAILGFVLAAAVLVFGLFLLPYVQVPALQPNGSDVGLSGFATLLYAFIALVYFFPSLYLYNFSTQLQRGLKEQKREQVRKAIRQLKIMFKFLSIMLLLFLVLFAGSLVLLLAGTKV
ncbi:hypothetical protein [Pontibacter oryzae]|uniref:Uncharacterized protein n=1 Tax=Pontibacter oryzae TaxID=2304593 RepID=A0A399S5Z8_9BACT|nr:hypothetical protein [Pontibacter oryzae]RIJ37492.1 hypothetical protein D1627_10265 [Pontibacter oryzae]